MDEHDVAGLETAAYLLFIIMFLSGAVIGFIVGRITS
jgi:hypothetical protein